MCVKIKIVCQYFLDFIATLQMEKHGNCKKIAKSRILPLHIRRADEKAGKRIFIL